MYGVAAALFVTGAAWLIADALKDGPSGDAWQEISANLLMVHGGVAMAMLMVLGALFPLHVRRGWRARKNRFSGGAMVTLNGLLIVTAFGLYYAGSDLVRPWISGAHIAAGFVLAVLIVLHTLLGRKASGTSVRYGERTRSRPRGEWRRRAEPRRAAMPS